MAAKGSQILLFRDPRALGWYAAELAKSAPDALQRKVTIAAGGAEWAYAVSGDLPPPSGMEERVEAAKGTISDREVVIEGKGKKKSKTPVDEVRELQGLVQAIPLIEADPAEGAVTALVPLSDAEEVLDAVSTAGRPLSGVAISMASGGRVFIRLERAPWFLIERGIGDDAMFLRQVPRKRIYVQWGYRHPLEAQLQEPPSTDSVLVVTADGHQVVQREPWEHAGPGGRLWQEVDVEATEGTHGDWRAAGDLDAITHEVRLVSSRTKDDPEVWVIGGEDPDGVLIRAFSRADEDDMRRVEVADLDAPEGRILVVRETGTGRRGPRVIPRGKGTYSHVAGSRGLFVPTGSRLAPDAPAYVYERAFGMAPGELALVDEDDGDVTVSKLPESAFHPALDAVGYGSPAPSRASRTKFDEPWRIDGYDPDRATEKAKQRKKKDQGEDEALEEILDGRGDERPKEAKDPVRLPSKAMDLEELIESLAADAVDGDKEVPKGERTEVDKLFKGLPATVQHKIDEAAKAVLSGRPRRNASSRDVARIRRLIVKGLVEAGAIKVHDEQQTKGRQSQKKSQVATDRLADLERRVLEEPEDSATWLVLAREYLEAGDADDALKAAEMAAWAGGDAEREAWKTLVAADASGAYDKVSEFSAKSKTLQPSEFAREANAAYEATAAAAVRRKRARWLLRAALAKAAGDDLLLEQERDAILLELATRGLAETELPSLVRRRILERYSAADASKESAGIALDLVEDMEKVADAIGPRSAAAAAELRGEAATYYALLGDAAKGLKQANEAISALRGGEQDGSAKGQKKRKAELTLPRDETWPMAIAGLAKAAAALVMVQEHDEGLAAFSTACEWIEKKEAEYDTWTAIQKVLDAMAQAGLRTGDEPVDRLVAFIRKSAEDSSGNKNVEFTPPKRVTRMLEDMADNYHGVSAKAIERLGAMDEFKEIARHLLGRDDLGAYDYEGASLFLGTAADVTSDDAAAMLKHLLSGDIDFNTLTGEYLIAPALAGMKDPLKVAADAVSNQLKPKESLSSGETPRDLQFRLYAILAALASGPDERTKHAIETFLPDLAKFLSESSPEERNKHMFMLDKALNAIPSAFADDRRRGMGIIRKWFDGIDANDGGEARLRAMSACASAAASLGALDEAIDMTEPMVKILAKEAQQGTRGVANSVYVATGWVANALAATGDKQTAARVTKLVLEGSRAKAGGSDSSFAARALAVAAEIAIKIDDQEAANELISQALETLSGASTTGATGPLDALEEVTEVAAKLAGSRRYEAARKIMAIIEAQAGKVHASGAAQTVASIAKTARTFMREEGPFEEALAKWHGDDEFRIRERVIAESASR